MTRAVTHWRVAFAGASVLSRADFARACDPTITTKSPLTTETEAVTCARCKLTRAFKEAQS